MKFSCEPIFGCLRMSGSILVIYYVFKIADWGGYDKLNMSLDQAFPLSVSITDSNGSKSRQSYSTTQIAPSGPNIWQVLYLAPGTRICKRHALV